MPVDLDIVHPATGELAEGSEDSSSTSVEGGRGGLVALKRDENTPKTQLVLRASPGLPSDSKFRIKTDIRLWTGSLKVWKDQAGTQAVVSEQTEFPANVDTTLYLEGDEKTGSDDLVITQQIKVGGNWVDGDKVSSTVVHAEIPVVLRAFIPHAWTSGEAPLPMQILPYPYLSNCVGGDRVDYSLKNYDLENTFRMSQEVVMTPYRELHEKPDLTLSRKDKTAISSRYYIKSEDVPESDQGLDFGEIFVGGATANWTFAPPLPTAKYTEDKRYKNGDGRDVTTITASLSGGPGAPDFSFEGFPNIDWEYVISMERVETGGLLLMRMTVSATHDLYPAYEVNVQNSNGIFANVHLMKPAASTLPGPNSLNHLTNVGESHYYIE